MGTPTSSLNSYFDALLKASDVVSAAVTQASDRTSRLATLATTEAVSAGRETIEFVRGFAADHREPASFLPRYTEFSAKAQDHAANYAKAALQESLDAAVEFRTTAGTIAEAGQEIAESLVAVAGEIVSGQAFADAVQAFSQPTKTGRKPA